MVVKGEIKRLRKWTLILYSIGILLCIPFLSGYDFPVENLDFRWLKFIHISSLIMFAGNSFIGPAWAIAAFLSGDKKVRHFAIRNIYWMDLIVTIPALFITIISGFLMAPFFGGWSNIHWMELSITILVLSIVPAIPFVFAQLKLYRLTYMEMKGRPIMRNTFRKTVFLTTFWGTICILPVLIIIFLMIGKPALW